MRAKKGASADLVGIPDKVVPLSQSKSARALGRAAAPAASTMLTKREIYALLTKEEQMAVDNLALMLYRRRHP
jgi:hypothetical protein